jgi:hypothetical protein
MNLEVRHKMCTPTQKHSLTQETLYQCLTVSGKKPVALYNAAETTLRVHPRGQPVLDDIG